MKIHIVFNKVTWYSRLLSIIFFFGVFPYVVFVIGQKYQEYIDIVDGTNAVALDWHNSDYAQNYGPINNQLYILENKAEGKWKSVSDPKYVVIFRNLNRYLEYYDGSVVNYGDWFLKQSLVNTRFSDLSKKQNKGDTYLYQRLINLDQQNASSSGKILKRTNKDGKTDLYEDDFIYQISFSSDYTRMTLVFLDSGKIMNFTREYYNLGSL